MLKVARKNIPDIKFQQADMVSLKLNRKFDVIICLFGSIGYVKNYKNLNKVIENFANHLKPGGIVIIEPWLTKAGYTSEFMTGLPSVMTYDGSDISISRFCVCKKRGNLATMDLHHLIAEKNKKVRYAIEYHELGMFEKDKTLEIMQKNGFKAKYMRQGLLKDMGLNIGIKPR